MKIFTTREASKSLGVSPRRITAMIRSGIIPAKKHGRDWLIKSDDLARIERKGAGRPKKEGVKT